MSLSKHGLSINDLSSYASRRGMKLFGEESSGQYVLLMPRKKAAWVGFGVRKIIRYRQAMFTVQEADGSVNEHVCEAPFDLLEEILGPQDNYFFMISLDLHRPDSRNDLPVMIWVCAKYELLIDETQAQPYSAANDSKECQDFADGLNQDVLSNRIPELQFLEMVSPSDHGTEWSTEDDEVFVERLDKAIAALQTVDGKIIVTRAYTTATKSVADPFRLFEIYNHLEPCCAASHFFRLDNDIFSLGCTPENIFSLKNRNLDFDVVASTRGVSPDPVKDALWEKELVSDEKELKEHNMALGRYQKRLGELCHSQSVVMDRHLDIRRFRYVRHLYSHLYGELREGINFFDLIKGSSPALRTYPEELVPVADDGVTPTRFYGGVVGRTGAAFSQADVFLNLRSLFNNKGELSTMGGVGVVRESRSELELIEVKNKLRCVMEAERQWQAETNS